MNRSFLTIFIFLVVFTGAMGQDSVAGSKKEYYISGFIEGINDKVPIYLVRLKDNDTVAICQTMSGKFILKGNYDEFGEMHFVIVDTAKLNWPKAKQSWIRVYLESDSIFINSNRERWPQITIIGSPGTKVYEEMGTWLREIREKERERILMAGLDSTSKVEISKESNARIIELFSKYPDELAVAEFAKNIKSFSYDEMSLVYNKMTQRVKSSYPGKLVKRRMVLLQPENQVKLNGIIPDFEYRDAHGYIRNIRQVVKTSKFTLIDFWASWCKPCIAEVPTLRSMYEKYSRCELQIVGISMDKNKEKWQGALKEIRPEWSQSIDMNGNITRAVFGIGSIPAYLLVDNAGRMVAFYCSACEFQSFGPYIKGEGLESALIKLLR